jgi:hypothetical protein
MAETSGFNGSGKPKLSEQISNSTKWAAFGRVSSVLSAVVGLVMTGVATWAATTLIEVQKTSIRTEVQLEDFKDDAERSRADLKDRLDRLTVWVAGSIKDINLRIDNLRR